MTGDQTSSESPKELVRVSSPWTRVGVVELPRIQRDPSADSPGYNRMERLEAFSHEVLADALTRRHHHPRLISICLVVSWGRP